MRECAFELYRAVYDAVRAGVVQRDESIIRRVSMHMVGRDAETTLVMTLAMIEAKRGDPPRTKERVCDGALCGMYGSTACPARTLQADDAPVIAPRR